MGERFCKYLQFTKLLVFSLDVRKKTCCTPKQKTKKPHLVLVPSTVLAFLGRTVFSLNTQKPTEFISSCLGFWRIKAASPVRSHPQGQHKDVP